MHYRYIRYPYRRVYYHPFYWRYYNKHHSDVRIENYNDDSVVDIPNTDVKDIDMIPASNEPSEPTTRTSSLILP